MLEPRNSLSGIKRRRCIPRYWRCSNFVEVSADSIRYEPRKFSPPCAAATTPITSATCTRGCAKRIIGQESRGDREASTLYRCLRTPVLYILPSEQRNHEAQRHTSTTTPRTARLCQAEIESFACLLHSVSMVPWEDDEVVGGLSRQHRRMMDSPVLRG